MGLRDNTPGSYNGGQKTPGNMSVPQQDYFTRNHEHNGKDSKKIDYNDLKNLPDLSKFGQGGTNPLLKDFVLGEDISNGMIVVVKSDGKIYKADKQFKYSTLFGGELRAVYVDEYGTFVAGTIPSFNGYTFTNKHFAKFNPDGTFDTNFIAGTFVSSTFGFNYSVRRMYDGKIGVNDGVSKVNTYSNSGVLGTVFDTFIGDSGVTWSRLNDFIVQKYGLNAGKVVVVGFRAENYSYSVPHRYARVFNVDGSSTSRVLGEPLGGAGASLYMSHCVGENVNDGTLWIGYRNTLIKADTDLNKITSGYSAPNILGDPSCLAVQDNGHVILGGSFTTVNSSTWNRIVRIKENGNIDNTFNIGTGFAQSGVASCTVYSIKVLPDGKILVGGKFDSFNGVSIPANLCRLNFDGTLDTTFTINKVGDNAVSADAVLGLCNCIKAITAVGSFTTVNGIAQEKIVSLSLDGAYEPDKFRYEENREFAIGYLENGGLSGETKTVTLLGGIATTTGKTPGITQYIQEDGYPTESVTDFKIGRALSTTEFLVTKNP